MVDPTVQSAAALGSSWLVTPGVMSYRLALGSTKVWRFFVIQTQIRRFSGDPVPNNSKSYKVRFPLISGGGGGGAAAPALFFSSAFD